MRIGVISDTHVPKKAKALPEAVLAAFRDADLILHAGDLVVAEVLDELQRLAPVVAVAGNNDSRRWPSTPAPQWAAYGRHAGRTAFSS